MARAHHQHGSAFRSLGKKVANVAGHLKTIYDVGSTVYHAAKYIAPIAVPIISVLTEINRYVFIIMGSTITMNCCSSEEIIPDDNKPNVPTIYTYPEYNFPRSNSELTKLALEDN